MKNSSKLIRFNTFQSKALIQMNSNQFSNLNLSDLRLIQAKFSIRINQNKFEVDCLGLIENTSDLLEWNSNPKLPSVMSHLFWSQYLIIGNSNMGANPSKGFGNASIRMNPNHSEIYFRINPKNVLNFFLCKSVKNQSYSIWVDWNQVFNPIQSEWICGQMICNENL